MRTVYGLANHLLEEDHTEYIFYVGEAENISLRLGYHLSQPEINLEKMTIIHDIFEETGLSPKVVILAKVEDHLIEEVEKKWILRYASINPNLTNVEHNPNKIRSSLYTWTTTLSDDLPYDTHLYLTEAYYFQDRGFLLRELLEKLNERLGKEVTMEEFYSWCERFLSKFRPL